MYVHDAMCMCACVRLCLHVCACACLVCERESSNRIERRENS